MNHSEFHSCLAWDNCANETAVTGAEPVTNHPTGPVEFLARAGDGRAHDRSQRSSKIARRGRVFAQESGNASVGLLRHGKADVAAAG